MRVRVRESLNLPEKTTKTFKTCMVFSSYPESFSLHNHHLCYIYIQRYASSSTNSFLCRDIYKMLYGFDYLYFAWRFQTLWLVTFYMDILYTPDWSRLAPHRYMVRCDWITLILIDISYDMTSYILYGKT